MPDPRGRVWLVPYGHITGHTLLRMLPLAHVGHWLWALYLPPILIVAGSIVRTKVRERRGDGKGED